MSLKPYSEYASAGTTHANAKWGGSMKFIVVGCTLLALVIGFAIAKNAGHALIGGFVGGFVGYGCFRLIVYVSAKSQADALYQHDWCAARDMRSRSDGVFPHDAPYANSGDKREAKDIFEGEWNGFSTLFYNFTYTVRGRGKDDSDTDYDFRIMRLTGRTLPIERLTIHQRSAVNRFKWVDKLQGALSPERPVSLESADFNAKFDLTIDDGADEIWIRRIFDPATITALVSGNFTIPDLKYYNGAWWVVESGHFQISELEQWPPKQKLAADAAEHLSRVQEI